MPAIGKRLILSLFTLLVAGACGGGAGEDYPPGVVQRYLDSCTAGGTSREICQCALDELEDKYSIEEFTEESIALSQGNPSDEFQQDIVEASANCQ